MSIKPIKRILLYGVVLSALLSSCMQSTLRSKGDDQLKGLEGGIRAKLQQELEEAADIKNNEKRYLELLQIHLRYPYALEPLTRLARTNMSTGDPATAEVWLKEARDRLAKASGHSKSGTSTSRNNKTQDTDKKTDLQSLKIWYLSAQNAYYLQQLKECRAYVKRLDSRTSLKGSDFFRAAQLLKARVFLSSGSTNVDRTKGVELVLELLSVNPEILDPEDVLRAAQVCITLGRTDEAGTLMSHYAMYTAYQQEYVSTAAGICEKCGLTTHAFLFKAEMEHFSADYALQSNETTSGTGPTGTDNYAFDSSGQSFIMSKVVSAVKASRHNKWAEVYSVLKALESEDALPKHRYISYLQRLSGLYCSTGDAVLQRKYIKALKWYGREQAYFSHLFKALNGLRGQGVPDELLERALRGCIASGPYSKCARQARKVLGEKAGLPPALQAEPLLETEMQRIIVLVAQGGNPQLLRPLVTALDWPENRYTLEAGLLLRRVRSLPGVRSYLRYMFDSVGKRGQARIKAILQL